MQGNEQIVKALRLSLRCKRDLSVCAERFYKDYFTALHLFNRYEHIRCLLRAAVVVSGHHPAGGVVHSTYWSVYNVVSSGTAFSSNERRLAPSSVILS